jgi:hypothetical protein
VRGDHLIDVEGGIRHRGDQPLELGGIRARLGLEHLLQELVVFDGGVLELVEVIAPRLVDAPRRVQAMAGQVALVGLLDMREEAHVAAIDEEVDELRAQAGKVRDGAKVVVAELVAHARQVVRVLVEVELALPAPEHGLAHQLHLVGFLRREAGGTTADAQGGVRLGARGAEAPFLEDHGHLDIRDVVVHGVEAHEVAGEDLRVRHVQHIVGVDGAVLREIAAVIGPG